MSHSWADFPCSMSPRLEYSRCPKEVGVRKGAFRRRIYRSVVAPSWVVEQPSLEKKRPRGGVIMHRRTRYTVVVLTTWPRFVDQTGDATGVAPKLYDVPHNSV